MAKMRVAMATQGTRGDFQPMLALGCTLARRGHEVFILGNKDHVETGEEFGLRGVVAGSEVKDMLKTEAGKKAMETGDLVRAFGALKEDTTDYYTPAFAALDEFKPDIVIFSALIAHLINAYKARAPTVPYIFAAYQPQCVPSEEFGPAPMFRVELEEGQPMLTKWIMSLQYHCKMAEDNKAELRKQGWCQDDLDKVPGAETQYHEMFVQDEQATPVLMAHSKAFWPAPGDWPLKGIDIVGRWSIGREEQDELVKKGSKFFDAGSQQQKCTEFIHKGAAPVYIGWGSMTVYSNEHMAQLAVDALRVAGQRGIIVAGWADVSSDSLASAPNAEELIEYCNGNVLFMKAAPHEWLFPQCCCCVHHGGIGTTQASLAAGSPTIVTPVFADQHDIAKRVTKEKWGTGTCLLSKLTGQELGEAIKKVCGDPTFKANVTKLAEKMSQEDGCRHTAELLERFVRDEVATGAFLRRSQEIQDKLKAIRIKQNKMTVEQKMGVYSAELYKRFPNLKAWNDQQMEVFTHLVTAATKGALWYIKGTKCLARAGEKLKSDEAGRYTEFTFVEVLEQKGSRLHVKRLKGVGPEKGWVSTEVKGVEIVVKVQNVGEIQRIIAEQYRKMFADVFD